MLLLNKTKNKKGEKQFEEGMFCIKKVCPIRINSNNDFCFSRLR
jgi:hypothetical protein